MQPDGRNKRDRALWKAFDTLPEKSKTRAKVRLAAIELFDRLLEVGMTKGHATMAVADRFDISRSTVSEWRTMVHGVERDNWLPALAPQYQKPMEIAPRTIPQDVAFAAFCESWAAMNDTTRAKALTKIGASYQA